MSLTLRHSQARSRTAWSLLGVGFVAILLAVFSMAAPVADAAPAQAATDPSGSAFGVSAQVTNSVTGPILDVPPTPAADSDTNPNPDSVASVDQAPIITTGILNASSNVSGGTVTSEASTVNAALFTDAVTASAVESTCSAGTGGTPTGDSTIADLTVGGNPQTVSNPNTQVTIPGVGTLFLNEQVITDNPDGTQTLTVNAIRLAVNIPEPIPGAGATTGEVIIAQSECTTGLAAATTGGTTGATTGGPGTTGGDDGPTGGVQGATSTTGGATAGTTAGPTGGVQGATTGATAGTGGGSASGTGGVLPRTGFPTVPLTVIGVLLMAAGGATLYGAQRGRRRLYRHQA